MPTCGVTGCEKQPFCRGWCRMHYMRWWTHGSADTLLVRQSPRGEPEKYLKVAIAYGGDECLLWPFSKNNRGYPQINRRSLGKQLVHRIVCSAINGTPPPDKPQVAHSCGNGNKGCVTTRHLRWASVRENCSDTIAHERTTRGEKAKLSKLTSAEALEIYARANAGENQRQLAKEYGVAQTLVSMIRLGKRWAWLTADSARAA